MEHVHTGQGQYKAMLIRLACSTPLLTPRDWHRPIFLPQSAAVCSLSLKRLWRRVSELILLKNFAKVIHLSQTLGGTVSHASLNDDP